jgi:hypothetical protein
MRFEATIEAAGGGGARIELPFDPKAQFGRARAPIRGTVNGVPFRSTVAIYAGRAYLGVRKDLRAAAGADIGDSVSVVVELDEEPREVTMPPELAPAAEEFAQLSYTHQREYARWIEEAKREETRARRVERAIELLRAGVKTPDAPSP